MTPEQTKSIEAVKKIRDLFPNRSQRDLARKIATSDFIEGKVQSLAFDVSEGYDTIYSRIRRYDKQKQKQKPTTPRYKPKPGDLVRVARIGRAFNFTPGFNNSWISPMDRAVGCTFRVRKVTSKGVYLDAGTSFVHYGFPPQVLELVEVSELVNT